MIKSNRGQLSIFMGITLIIVMSMLAFIINVGLFVKAKINLQNAADAAAFSGAATQARQLTNIAYANWELRNTYKEWMFKYYVLGQLGLFPYNLKNVSGKGPINFILPTPPISGVKDFDKYNIPSICIHNNSKTNICPIYALPGIPRFPAIGVAGIQEIHNAFVDKLVEEKGKDCSRRSKANFLTALSWAYGAGGVSMPEAPLVATNRPGAWPQALELALRIRNLEMIVNRPPVPEINLTSVTSDLGQAADIGLNERPIKAFWSAYRNLGGGAYKDCALNAKASCGNAREELSLNLKLTELAPQPFRAEANSVSGFLIPDYSYPGANGGSAREKHYLDLQLMPLNLATMFTTFVDMANINNAIGGVMSEAACGVSKTALPVPGYILGFNKNPEVLTYYAVKAESKFIGLFFPLANSGIKLTAYAAAKPFGGRIGPKLFGFENNQTVVTRKNDKNNRASSYISGLEVEKGALVGFKPGMPIPSSSRFWVNNMNTNIGGVPGIGAPIFFGIPNMIYDFDKGSDLEIQQGSSSENVQLISPPLIAGLAPKETLGLYHAPQFKSLKDSIGPINPGTSMSSEDVMKSIIRARRATKYDAINYLVPDFRDDNNNAAPIVEKLSNAFGVGYTYKLFAPLLGPNLLYKNPNEIGAVAMAYMEANKLAVEIYLQSLLDVANSINKLQTQGDNKEAARSIHINAGTMNPIPAMLKPNVPASDPDCKNDMASKFNYFFNTKSTATACEIVPLTQLMVSFIDMQTTNENGLDKRLYYVAYYYNDPSSTSIMELTPDQLKTAYFPGDRQGTQGDTGIAEHPLKLSNPGNESYSTKRNYYSTKFFQMAKVLDTGSKDYDTTPALREMANDSPADLVKSVQLKNPLKYSEVGNNPYFLDF